MTKFKDLTRNKQCLLVGRTARMYDQNMTVQEIAEKLNEPIELVKEMIDIIIVAKQNKERAE